MIDHVTIEPEEPGAGPPPQRLGHSLDRVLAGLGSPPVAVLSTIVERWPELIGPDAAKVCRPVSVEHGCLSIAVEQTAWVSQLRWMEADLIRRATALLGPGVVGRVEVRGVRRGIDLSVVPGW